MPRSSVWSTIGLFSEDSKDCLISMPTNHDHSSLFSQVKVFQPDDPLPQNQPVNFGLFRRIFLNLNYMTLIQTYSHHPLLSCVLLLYKFI